MTNSERDKRALILLAAGLLVAAIVYYGFPANNGTGAGVPTESAAAAQQRLVRLRQIVSTAPAEEALAKRTAADLADREHGMLQADTAAQGQAVLLEIASRVGKNDGLDVRGGDFAAPKEFGNYGLVFATITFECHVEQLVNFLADLAKEPELVAPSEEHITAANPKDKTMNVRMVLAGVVPKKLVPVKKGLGAL